MSELLEKVENHVIQLLNTQLDLNYLYHNLIHTQRVVEAVKELIEHESVSEKEGELLQIAAWFHDTGFIKTNVRHEEVSVEIALEFLQNHDIDDVKFGQVERLILATQVGHQPKNQLEKIIIDADCSHLASKSFFETNQLLRKEWELQGQKKMNDKEWFSENIEFFTHRHKYYTEYALKNWNSLKQKNLSKLMKDLNKINNQEKKYKQKKEEVKIKKDKNVSPERGVETMFRVALKNHMTLSNIADTKSNILLSVNAIIISLALSNLLPKLDNPSNAYLIIPTIIFSMFTVATIILSILATRPNVTRGKFTKDDVAQKKVNLLFFGNFHQMDLSDFEWGISEMMEDREYLYGSLTKDLYFLGLVLNKKYKILRLTYTVFMVGIITSVIAFAISFSMLPS